MQLVAYGAQDIYLTGNPQITFFKVVYRRHTNFSMESIEQSFNGQNVLGGKVTAVISRNGDLIHKMYVSASFSKSGDAASANFGTALLKTVELEIGGQKIDKLYTDWLETWAELTEVNPAGRIARVSAENLVANTGSTLYQKMTGSGGIKSKDNSTDFTNLTIPLPFWFCKNVGLSLPLIALQYHEVKVEIEYGSALEMGGTGELTSGSPPSLWVDYIYLDTDERRRFAQVSHEYLIEQLQVESKSASNDNSKFKMNLDFNHPVKELIWVNQKNNNVAEETGFQSGHGADATTDAENSKNDYFNYLSNLPTAPSAGKTYIEYINGQKSIEGFDKMTLKLNGHDRFEKRNASYFRLCQPYQSGHKIPEKHIYCYSFALKPQEHQPSGTCNFSRIDDAEMIFDGVAVSTANTITCYAINYNVLRIMSGMGGLAYSN